MATKSSAKNTQATAKMPASFNKNGSVRKNSATRTSTGNFTGRQMQRARRMGNALAGGATGRGRFVR